MQTILYSERLELRSATRCLQPLKSRKINSNETLSFVGCDFTDNQKWKFRPVATSPANDAGQGTGQLVHVESGRCLTLVDRSPKRTEKSVLSFLASIALEPVLSPGAPYLEDCKPVDIKDETQTQLWLMNQPADWKNV